ncbi:MAG: M1 family metallopeptidase [candidate division Zixibacteria bacterium]|nr:M1 family metallopeptidase [candidate division Zixibacteria bacterium]
MKKAALILLLCLTSIVYGDEYFQQKVDYKITAELIPSEASLKGSELVTYYNNSPNTLDRIYFYLYLNAFKPGSNLDLESQRYGRFRLAEMPAEFWGEMIIEKIAYAGIEFDDYKIDDTIMEFMLPQELAPGDSISLYLEYTMRIPPQGYRMGRIGDHYDIAQWFPKVAVYDQYGWHLSQYQNMSEFYSDFGDYDIRITAPDNFLIAHCGELLNEKEIYGANLPVPPNDSIIVDLLSLVEAEVDTDVDRTVMRFVPQPDSLNGTTDEVTGILMEVEPTLPADTFIEGEMSDEPFIDLFDRILLDLPFDGLTDYSNSPDTKTWIFSSDDVHDFAFSADPHFIVDRTTANGVIVDCYYKKAYADNWSIRAIVAARDALNYFSRLVGSYPYKHYSLVGGSIYGGMEYPTLSLVNMRYGQSIENHGFEKIIAHEIAHAWFYGMIASNQAEQSFIDEGFATFITCLFIEQKFGRYENLYNYRSELKKRLMPGENCRNRQLLYYINSITNGVDEKLDTPVNKLMTRDAFHTGSYDKASTILFHLQYVMGDQKFLRFLREIYKRWRFSHPYLNDIERLATKIHGRSLRYFFDQWYQTKWYLDYSLDGVKAKLVVRDGINWYETDMKLSRHGRCISPLDLVVSYDNGESETIRINETTWADGLDRYSHSVYLPLKPVRVELNPDGRIPDINRVNNNWRWPKFRFQIDTPRLLFGDAYIQHYTESYTLAHRPGIWYNEIDGVKLGYSLKGSYLGLRRNLDLKLSIGTLNGRIGYDIKYDNLLSFDHPGFKYRLASFERDGRGHQSLEIDYQTPGNPSVSSVEGSLALKRQYLYDDDYLSFPQHWQPGNINSLNLVFQYMKNGRDIDHLWTADIMTSAPGSEFRFSRLSFSWSGGTMASPNGKLNLDIAGGLSEGDVPSQYRFYLAEASPYKYFDNKWYSSRGTLPGQLKRDHNLFLGDGLAMPGYLFMDKSGLKQIGGRIQFEFIDLAGLFELPDNFLTDEFSKIRFRTYITHAAVWDDPGLVNGAEFLTEAGLWLSYGIPFWNRLFGDEKLHLFFPFVLSDPENDESSFKFRWAISISR